MHRSGVSGRLAIAQSYEEGVPKGHDREGPRILHSARALALYYSSTSVKG